MNIPDDVMKTAEALWGGSVLDIARAIMVDRKSRWQPIETAPKDGTTILLCENDIVFSGGWSPGLRIWTDNSMDNYNLPSEAFPTHWMPLPTPPTGGDHDTD